MRGFGLTLAEDIPTTAAPIPLSVKPYSGIRLPYYRTDLMNGAIGPNRASGEYINGVFYPKYPVPSVSSVERQDSGPFGLSDGAFKWIVLAGLAYAILKK